MAVSKPYGDSFTQLTPTIFYHEPRSPITASSTDPDLILLAPWLNALPRHIAKYTAGYQVIYPQSRILMITTATVHVTVSSASSRENRIKPLLEILYSLAPNSRILLHFFSNGGAASVSLIAKQYRLKTGKPLPVQKAVFDSSPGKATYTLTVRALSVALPKNFFAWLVSSAILRLFLVCWYAMDLIVKRENPIDTARRDLNDKDLLPLSAERLYIYSERDEMVEWKDVEEHIADAEEKGYVVSAEKYKDSGHAGHLMKDEKRYWGAVTRLWEGKE